MEIAKAAQLAVANTIKEGLTDIFPPPTELSLLKNEQFRRTVTAEVIKCVRGNTLDSMAVSPIDHVLLPKGGPFDFRRCALMQPLDTIKYLALVLTVADKIEARRPHKRTQIAFSYRLLPQNGYVFDGRYNITSFKKSVIKRSRNRGCKFLVSCDIAGFYDRINLHRLESVLLSLGIEKKRVRQINDLLLFWANRDSYGLPVGSNASRILAEAALLEVDKYMQSIGAKFARFVDDYRLFAPDAHRAHHWLTQLIERLWLEGLTINKSKTSIEDVAELERTAKDDTGEGAAAVPWDKSAHKLESRQGEAVRPQFRIVAGYGGVIPTRFRTPSTRELRKFRGADPARKLRDLKSKKLPAPDDITGFVKAVVTSKKYDEFSGLPEVADLFPQFSPYVVDVLCKYADMISPGVRNRIRDKFVRRLKGRHYLPEYITIAIVGLLGSAGFASKEALLRCYRELRRNAGAYIGRALLDSLEEHVSRGEVLEIRRHFSRGDAWEKRQIVRIVDRHLQEEEKRPWLKNVRAQEERDLFLVEMVSRAQKKT